MAKRSRSSDLQWLEVEEAPRAGLPDTKRLVRRSRLMRAFVWASVVLFPITLLAFISTLGNRTVARSSAAGAHSSPGRTVATGTLTTWLNTDPSPLPGARIISWDGAEVVSRRTVEPNPRTSYVITTESNRFTVGVPAPAASAPDAARSEPPTVSETSDDGPDGSGDNDSGAGDTGDAEDAASGGGEGDDGRGRVSNQPQPWSVVYEATVLVEVDSRGGAKAITRPSIMPIISPIGDSWENTDPRWPGLANMNVPSAVNAAISRWSSAYISADPEDLRLATGDPSASNLYQPLIGPTSVSTTTAGAGSDDDGLTMAVRVRLWLLWPGHPDPEDRESTQAPPMEMDVLVHGASTGSPVIVAWGPSGSGHELEPYGNATSGNRDIVGVTTTSTVTTTTTAPATTTTATTPAPAQPAPAQPAPAQPAPAQSPTDMDQPGAPDGSP